jgi:hypothetical protein
LYADPGTYWGHEQHPRYDCDRQELALQAFIEADDEARTRDLRLGKPTLYQLSYIRVPADSRGQEAAMTGVIGSDSGPTSAAAAACGERDGALSAMGLDTAAV